MKKQRPCTSKRNRSPLNSPRAVNSSASGSSVKTSLRSKSIHNFKRKRPPRGLDDKNVSKQPQTSINDDADLSFFGLKKKKKDVFGSLESLFDVKKPINLPPVVSLTTRRVDHELCLYSNFNLDSPRNPTIRLLADLYQQESNNVSKSAELSSELRYKCDVSKLEQLELDIVEETIDQQWDDREGSLVLSGNSSDMAEEKDQVEIENATPLKPSAPPEEEEKTIEQSRKDQNNSQSASEEAAKPPEFPLPPGIGGGVSPKNDQRSESIISSTSLTDSEVIRGLAEANERCKIVGQEMEDLRREISELKHKENITDEDAKQVQDKQVSLMAKMQEFDEITRNITKIVGLANPSSQTFAKMFDMLPYPHTKPAIPEVDETEKREIVEKEHRTEILEYERFDLPQPEYPEDKLPRAIVCGFTEDRIPKIVIPDSRPKGTRCLENLTGKLSESLNMQEKLVEENAKLEGGKYKLEEALLEKDNTLDSLQRKVCSLQAEMRIVVKENTELNQQLSWLTNQRSTGSPCQVSSRSTNRLDYPQQAASNSYASSPRQNKKYCPCNNCMQQQLTDSESLQTNRTICMNPDGYNTYEKPCASNSPRLSGGGSQDESYCNSNPMCCRGPANAAKLPGASIMRTGACPAEMENTMTNYGNSTNQLAQQLESMESEVRNMQMELANVHRERQQLEQQRKLLKCTGPCAPCSCCPPGMSSSIHQPSMIPCVAGGASTSIHQPAMIPCVAGASTSIPPQIPESPIGLAKMAQQHPQPPSCSGICVDAPMGASTCPQQQLRDLREQYARLQEDYRNKLCEVSCLRADADKMKQETREAKEEREKAENRLVDAQERLKSMQSDKHRFHGSKEQLVEQEQALLVATQRYREAQDELEDLRSLIQDQASQLEDYRNKYLEAQEQVEEQRRQLDLMELDNARMNENVNLEIGKVKNHFLGKLAEFAPLADIVKQTQTKLQEVQQLRLIAERNCEDLTRELLTCKDQLGTMQSQLSAMRSANSALNDEKGMGSGRCEELEKKNSDLKNENERMKNSIARLEEQESQLQQRLDEKQHEVVQLTAMLEQVREDSARQVARTKERCETIRRSMQGQIAEMEKQLAQCRATARAAQKDRDEIRQKMQGQINNLNEAFEQAQGRIRSLQGHVNYLKTSYSNIFSPGVVQGEGPTGFMPSETPGQGQGYDSCDCNY